MKLTENTGLSIAANPMFARYHNGGNDHEICYSYGAVDEKSESETEYGLFLLVMARNFISPFLFLIGGREEWLGYTVVFFTTRHSDIDTE